MDARVTAAAVVFALLCPLPLMYQAGEEPVEVSTDLRGWEAPLITTAPRSDTIDVLDLRPVSKERKLTYVSIQGLSNRELASCYVIISDEDAVWLSSLVDLYGINVNHVSEAEFLERHGDVAGGYVKVDPRSEDTVNIATMLSGLLNYAIVYPSTFQFFSGALGDKDIIDLSERPWKSRTGMELYTYAFDRYFSMCTQRFLGFIPPDIVRMRDLLISQGAFCFYQVPGPWNNPKPWEDVRSILKESPGTHAVIGSIEPWVGAEEDFATADFSRHGKYFIPAARVPNLSILSSFEELGDRDLGGTPSRVELKDEFYVAVAVEDGDNMAFMHDTMRDHWDDEARGRLPISWSVQPWSAVLAPPMVEYYSATRSPRDDFIMGPSGAGLAFPGEMPELAYEQFLRLTQRQKDDLGLDVCWILNGYRPYEVYHPQEVLDDYASMGFDGLILDYDDIPFQYQYSMAGSGVISAPVVRNTQLWASADNLRAKLDVALSANPDRPMFIMLGFNPWATDLSDLEQLLDDLGANVVDVPTFFDLIEQAVMEDADETLEKLEDVPTSALFGTYLSNARDLNNEAQAEDDPYIAWKARTYAEIGIGLALAVLVILVVLFLVALTWMIGMDRGFPEVSVAGLTRGAVNTLILTSFMVVFRWGFFQDLWHYFPITAATVMLPPAGIIVSRLKNRSMVLPGAILFLTGMTLIFASWWALPIAVLGAFLLIDWTASGHVDELVIPFTIAMTFSTLAPASPGLALTLAFLVPVSLVMASRVRDGRFDARGSRAGAFVLPMLFLGVALADSRYLCYRFGFLPGALRMLSTVIPITACGLGWLWMNERAIARRGFLIGILLFAFSWALIPFVDNLSGLAVLLVFMQTGLVMSAISAGRRGVWKIGPMYTAISICLFMAYNIFVYATPVYLDTYVFQMGYHLNYALYHHPTTLMLASIFLVLIVYLESVLDRRSRRKTGLAE